MKSFIAEPRTQRSKRPPRATVYSAALRARLGRKARDKWENDFTNAGVAIVFGAHYIQTLGIDVTLSLLLGFAGNCYSATVSPSSFNLPLTAERRTRQNSPWRREVLRIDPCFPIRPFP
jgi:hypothetical protein